VIEFKEEKIKKELFLGFTKKIIIYKYLI